MKLNSVFSNCYIWVSRASNPMKHPNRSLVLKIGWAKDVDRQLEQWQSQCYMDEIQLVWEIPCEHTTKIERLVHLKLKSENTWITPFECESCRVRHQEKFDIVKVGGVEEAKRIMESLKKKLVEEYGD
ncbi:hypothetical protein B0H10DRAFT_1962650 [Mycena sp. CBHHK59/15]|nr:hypothetical protein B0H10DRAFT_1962650 [Mycena sp. CBHHK59/15]